jgi:uncharacterized protein
MSLQYNVAGLLKEPVGETRDVRIDASARLGDSLQRISGKAQLLRTPRGILVGAALDGELTDECSRCLKPISQNVHLEIEEEFVQTVDIDSGRRLAEGADPDDFRIDSHHVLDLEDAVRQYWSTALPIQVLCGPECRGLCSRCGADLNVGPHECDTPIDERWSALGALVSKKEGS